MLPTYLRQISGVSSDGKQRNFLALHSRQARPLRVDVLRLSIFLVVSINLRYEVFSGNW